MLPKKNLLNHLHPAASFIYMFMMTGMTIVTLNPFPVIESLVLSSIVIIYIYGMKELKNSLYMFVAVGVFLIIVLPLFSHRGETPLFYLNDSPVTLESVFFGGVMTFMLVAAYQWMYIMTKVFDSEKTLYIIGKISNTLGLLFSMILGMIPELRYRYRQIDDVQKGMGRDAKNMAFADKLKMLEKKVSVLISLSLEQSGERAISMESRGYGIGKRTAFDLFIFRRRDLIVMVILIIICIYIFISIIEGGFEYNFYPDMKFNLDIFGIIAMIVYGICALTIPFMPVR